MVTRSRILALIALAAMSVSASARQQSTSAIAPKTAPNPQAALEDAIKKQLASFEKQKQAIQTQLASKMFSSFTTSSSQAERLIQPAVTFSQPDCLSLESGRIDELVSAAAQKQSLDPALLKAVMRHESGFKPCATSVKGAQGLMQLMPSTARSLHVNDAFDPVQNVHAGAAYLRQLLNRYKGDLRLALAGYNAGPARADQSIDAILPVETQNYVANILAELGIGESEPAIAQEDLAPSDDEAATPSATNEPKSKP